MSKGGSIVATSSLNAVQASNSMSAYCVSKAGLAMLVQVAALELGPRGIRVNAIAPGLVRTPLTDAMWSLPAIVEDFDENAPLNTTTSAEDVANLVTFLASDESSSITGTLQLIDRGAHTKRYPDMPAHFAARCSGNEVEQRNAFSTGTPLGPGLGERTPRRERHRSESEPWLGSPRVAIS